VEAHGVQAATTQRSQAKGEESENRKAQYWFGVAVENLPPPIARQLKLSGDQGLMVMAVLRDSPAERAGIKADDLLIEIEGHPLTSQEELAQAANTVDEAAEGAAPRPKTSRLTLLREGDRVTVEVTPSPRPAWMTAAGGKLENFWLQKRPAGATDEHVAGVRNYVLPNGGAAQVGPGYRIDLHGRGGGGAVSDISIRQLVEKGQTIILTQEQDGAGGIRNSITVGGQRYVVEPGKIATLPAEIQPIAAQLLAETGGGAGGGEATLDQRVKDLEKQNQQLQNELADLIKLLKEKNAGK
jgi:hypothetical protein